MKHRYLIFGSGFIAEHYARFLLARNQLVRVFFHTHKNPRLPASIQQKSSSQLNVLSRLLSSYNPHYILLTQGVSFIPANEKEIERSVASNVISPLVVLEDIYRLRKKDGMKSLKKILTFGSAAEYGNSDTRRWTEKVIRAQPTSVYGLVKGWLFEASAFYTRLGLPCVHLRHFNAVGAGQDPRFVVSAFCNQVARMETGKQKPILMVGDLNQKRDFIDIRDAMKAYELTLKKAPPGQVVNICSGKTRRVSDIVAILKKIASIPFSLSVDKRLKSPKRTRDKTLTGKPEWLLKNGWQTSYSLEKSVRWTFDYWKNRQKNS